MSTKYLQGPQTTSSVETPLFVTVTHPYHPLRGQKLELVQIPRRVNSELLVRHPEGRSFRIPRDWTDYNAPQAEQTEASPTHLLDIKGLRELAKIISNIDSENSE
jgi:hypothetical protein